MIEVIGKGGIIARIVADSCSAVDGSRITTFELTYPRFIHSELLTHRLFSRNAASSRAIPVKTMLELVRTKPAMPIHWGANQAGMQAKEECTNTVLTYNNDYDEVVLNQEQAWKKAADDACMWAELFSEAGYHKQIVNRLLEPFQMMKTVLTATEFDNFFHLRLHPDAQPEIMELATVMYEALEKSNPEELEPGEWHTPYVEHEQTEEGLRYITYQEDGYGFYTKLENALKISASCCAQVSYRKSDDSLEKALMVYDRLVNSQPVHASPFEHQATPMMACNTIDLTDDTVNVPTWPCTWEAGVTHADCEGCLWSGNFKRWIQYRQLIKNNVCTKFEQGEQ